MIPIFSNMNFIQSAFMSRDISALKKIHGSISELAQVKQVHSNNIICLKQSPSLSELEFQEADAIISSLPKLSIAVRTADCVPILIAHPEKVIAAVHAGWRGSSQEILKKTLLSIKQEYCVNLEDARVAIGPSICQDCYEVGEDVASFFQNSKLKSCLIKKLNKKYLLNLKQINYFQAVEVGVATKNIWVHPDCTFCQPDAYYSYRFFKKNEESDERRNYSWIQIT